MKFNITMDEAPNQRAIARMLGVDEVMIRISKTMLAPGFAKGGKTEINCKLFVPWFEEHYDEILELTKDNSEVLRIEESKALKLFYDALLAKDTYLESRKQLVPITDVELDYRSRNLSIAVLLMQFLVRELGSRCYSKSSAEIDNIGRKTFAEILNIINGSAYCTQKIEEKDIKTNE